MQRLAGMDAAMDRMRGRRGLGEVRQDKLALAGIGRDVADGDVYDQDNYSSLGRRPGRAGTAIVQ